MKRKLLEYLKKIDSKEEEFIKNEKNVLASYVIQKGSSMIDTDKMIREGAMIDIIKQPRFVDIPEHTHKYMEIIYMFSGSATHIIDKTEVKLEADDVLFIKQGTPHSASASGYNDIGIKIFVLPEFLQYPLSMLNEDTALRRFIKKAAENDVEDHEFLHFHLQDLPDAQNLLENMTRSLLNQTRNSKRILQATMGVLLMELSNRTYTITVGSPSSYESQIVLEALRYIEENYQTASLNTFCEHHNLPCYYVSRLMTQYSPYTFTKYLQRRRMLQAAYLLTETDTPIEQIVVEVGYENSSHFHKLFKEEYGMTPKKYRDKYDSVEK